MSKLSVLVQKTLEIVQKFVNDDIRFILYYEVIQCGSRMSLTKLLKSPIKFFKKDVISFLIIRRHDLGHIEENLRYVAVKPNASMSVLRHKIWHLLDLPDYCEEVIILKSYSEAEIPLTDLRKGNDPHHPFVLEVWLPNYVKSSSTMNASHMLTMGDIEKEPSESKTDTYCDTDKSYDGKRKCGNTSIASETTVVNNSNWEKKKGINSRLQCDYMKSELSSRVSSSSMMFKLNGRKSRDNFANILLKIQSDLCSLSDKLSNLENRIPQ